MTHLLLPVLLGSPFVWAGTASSTGTVNVLLRNTGVGSFSASDPVTITLDTEGSDYDRTFTAPADTLVVGPGQNFAGATAGLLVYDGVNGNYRLTVSFPDTPGTPTVTLASNLRFTGTGTWFVSTSGVTAGSPGPSAAFGVANIAPPSISMSQCRPDPANPAQNLALAWTLPTRPADFERYILQRSGVSSSNWVNVATFSSFGTAQYTDTNLTPNTPYRYRVVHQDRYDATTTGAERSCATATGDIDFDGFVSTAYGGKDCDDTNPSIRPGATEVPDDGIDQDCDGFDLITIFDSDEDGVLDDEDNCRTVANENQADGDGDAAGDACDPDDDNDGVGDEVDVCPAWNDPDQADLDLDGEGDACDLDDDGDLVDDEIDVCPRVSDADQFDLDHDSVGDVCDGDDDGDGVTDDVDVCPEDVDPDQADADGDGSGDVCDPFTDTDGDLVVDDEDVCPAVADAEQVDSDTDGAGDACDVDDDNDGVDDDLDLCTVNADPLQEDADGDGAGNACDADDDDDGVDDEEDNCVFDANSSQADLDGDEVGDTCDDDDDNDAVADSADNCDTVANADQFDNDDDGAGDACDDDDDNDSVLDDTDNCQHLVNADQADLDLDAIGDVCDPDDDGDEVIDLVDNCPVDVNPEQDDTDVDGVGDTCDPDDDEDGVGDSDDVCAQVADPEQEDLDCDGAGDVCDEDIDGDGVTDDMDACPDVATYEDDLVEDGCPDDACDLVTYITSRSTSEIARQAVTSLRVKAQGACSTSGTTASNHLTALANELRAQRGRKVAPETADVLLGAIDWIEVEQECASVGLNCDLLDPCAE